MSDAHASAHGHDDVIVDHSHHTHVCSFSLFFGIYAALLFLTVVTVGVAQFDFGEFNMLIAMGIAAVKASLVVTVFMHLRWDTAINNIVFFSSILFLSLLFLFTLADVFTRGEVDPESGAPASMPAPAEPLFHKMIDHGDGH